MTKPRNTAVFLIAFLLIALQALRLFASPLPAAPVTDSLKNILSKKPAPKVQIATMIELGRAYYSESKLDEALKNNQELLKVISRYGTKNDSAVCFRLIGLVYLQKAWYDKALANLMEARQLFELDRDTMLLAKSLMNIGIVHDCMENQPMSLLYYYKALNYFTLINKESGIADCKLNIAIVNIKQKHYATAGDNLLAAAEIYKRLGNDSYLAAAYLNLGSNYKRLQQYKQAIQYYTLAHDIWNKQDDQYHLCYYELNMGEIMMDMHNTARAGQYLNRAAEMATELGATDLQANAWEFLSNYKAETGDYASAFRYLKKSKHLNDSLRNAQTADKINQVQYKYEIARREADNAYLVKLNLDKELQISKKNIFLYFLIGAILLTGMVIGFLLNQNRIKRRANQMLEEKNSLIEKQKAELVRLNAAKDKFLTILAHDIKNPVSTMMGISQLLTERFETLSEAERKEFTNDMSTLSNNLYEIVNTLLTWAISQGGLTSVHPVKMAVDELTAKAMLNMEVVASQKNITIVNRTAPGLTVCADKNMVMTVLHNLLGNAVKFSFRGSEIRIEAQPADNSFALISVTDSGTGLSESNIAKLFQYDQHFIAKGTAGESGTGLGLILCKDFIEKNGGKIWAESEPGKGSRFAFTLPLA